MGLFDEVENLAGDTGGQGGEDNAEDKIVQDVTQQGEQFLDNETGDKFDSEIQQGGNFLDQQADQDLPKL